tara:strand:- start:5860 stop:6228 length:369 start_codon:yes stop_codon:yes gene_type:complete
MSSDRLGEQRLPSKDSQELKIIELGMMWYESPFVLHYVGTGNYLLRVVSMDYVNNGSVRVIVNVKYLPTDKEKTGSYVWTYPDVKPDGLLNNYLSDKLKLVGFDDIIIEFDGIYNKEIYNGE